MQANIFKIERLNTHNGPGFRTVIYFKGCPLKCVWCHNPESIKTQKQVWVLHAKCIGCGQCIDTCPNDVISLKDGNIHIDQDNCVGCQKCADACPTKAIEKIGEDYSLNDIMHIIRQDKMLFDMSGGGVTVTGGEPGIQSNFVAALFEQCRQEGIHTAFDTCGAISNARFEEVLEHSDLVFLDLKIFESKNALKYTGLNPPDLLEKIHWLKAQKDSKGFNIEFRTPLIPGLTDDIDNLNSFAEEIVHLFPGSKWELCEFNDICEDKYQRLDTPWYFSKHDKKIKPTEIRSFCHTHIDIPFQFSGLTQDFKNMAREN